MGDMAEIALPRLRKHPAPRPPLAFPADEELADRGIVALDAGRVLAKIPGPPAGMGGIGLVADERMEGPPVRGRGQTARSTSSFLVSAIALAGFRPFGQTLAQFMIVWQR